MATLSRHDPRSSAVFENHIRSLPQVIAADNIAGENDYILSVVARDVAELAQVLASLSGRGGQRLVTVPAARRAEAAVPAPVGRRPPPRRPPRRRGPCASAAEDQGRHAERVRLTLPGPQRRPAGRAVAGFSGQSAIGDRAMEQDRQVSRPE